MDSSENSRAVEVEETTVAEQPILSVDKSCSEQQVAEMDLLERSPLQRNATLEKMVPSDGVLIVYKQLIAWGIRRRIKGCVEKPMRKATMQNIVEVDICLKIVAHTVEGVKKIFPPFLAGRMRTVEDMVVVFIGSFAQSAEIWKILTILADKSTNWQHLVTQFDIVCMA